MNILKKRLLKKTYNNLKKAAVVVLILTVALVIYIAIEENMIVVTNYTVNTDKFGTSARAVFISDLHSKEFGKGNKRLLEKIQEQSPDFILVGGDMNVKTVDDAHVAIELMENLVKLAPVYYTQGNHERDAQNSDQLIEQIRATGVTYLLNEGTFFSKDGHSLYIGGQKDYPYYDWDYPDYDNPERHFLDSFIEHQNDYYCILLAHCPEWYAWGLCNKNIDLMLSGHTHGGIIRIPFVGGIIAPNQGLFPKYDRGDFETETGRMIITSGLGNAYYVPRINNPPEICVININM